MNPTFKKAVTNGSILSIAITLLVSVMKAGVCKGCAVFYLTHGGLLFSLAAFLTACVVVIPIMYIALLVNKHEDTGADTIGVSDSTSSIINFFEKYKDTLFMLIVFIFVSYLIWLAFSTFFAERNYGAIEEDYVDEYFEQYSN